ncbi:MAG: hypothetical protein ACRDHW_21185, partial [Ktedonobacteraceae bacterium]
MRFPLVIAVCALVVLFVARPLLHAHKQAGETLASLQSIAHDTAANAQTIPNADLADVVNPFIGTGRRADLTGSYGDGETFP